MKWPSRRMYLWDPISPGMKVHVFVRWPRYLRKPKFATLAECVRENRRVREYQECQFLDDFNKVLAEIDQKLGGGIK